MKHDRFGHVGVLATALLVALPGTARACAVCFSATEQNRIAFLVTTILLTLLPLALIGGGLLWLRRQAMRMNAETRMPRPKGGEPSPATN